MTHTRLIILGSHWIGSGTFCLLSGSLHVAIFRDEASIANHTTVACHHFLGDLLLHLLQVSLVNFHSVELRSQVLLNKRFSLIVNLVNVDGEVGVDRPVIRHSHL